MSIAEEMAFLLVDAGCCVDLDTVTEVGLEQIASSFSDLSVSAVWCYDAEESERARMTFFSALLSFDPSVELPGVTQWNSERVAEVLWNQMLEHRALVREMYGLPLH